MDILAVYVGLDYHSDSIQVCVMAENGEVLLNRSVASEVGCVVEAVRSASPAILVRGVAIEACTGSAEFARSCPHEAECGGITKWGRDGPKNCTEVRQEMYEGSWWCCRSIS